MLYQRILAYANASQISYTAFAIYDDIQAYPWQLSLIQRERLLEVVRIEISKTLKCYPPIAK